MLSSDYIFFCDQQYGFLTWFIFYDSLSETSITGWLWHVKLRTHGTEDSCIIQQAEQTGRTVQNRMELFDRILLLRNWVRMTFFKWEKWSISIGPVIIIIFFLLLPSVHLFRLDIPGNKYIWKYTGNSPRVENNFQLCVQN